MDEPFIFGNIRKGRANEIMTDNGNGCFTYLPEEIIVEIFSYLSLPDLKDSIRVCKNWNRAFNHPRIQRKCILVLNDKNMNEFQINYKKGNFYNVRFDRINIMQYTEKEKFWEELMPNIQFLSFHCCAITEYQLLSILQKTKNLKILKIWIWNINRWTKTWDWKLETMTNNKNWNFDFLKNIQHFEFSPLREETSNCFHQLLKVMTNLGSLLVQKVSPNNSLQKSVNFNSSKEMRNEQIDATVNTWENYLCKYIKKVLLSLKFIKLEGFTFNEIEDIVKINNLKLEKFILSENNIPVQPLLNRIVEWQPSITHLEIPAINENNDLITICNNLQNLKFLEIFNCKDIDDNGIIDLWKLSQLESLSLHYCKNMTTGGFTNALKETNDNLQSLKLWRLNSCENLLIHIVDKFVQLRELDLWCESGITENEIQNVWRNLRWLKKLVINCNEMTVTDFAYTGKDILNEFEINGCSIANVVDLEHLELNFENRITISSLLEIAKLKELVYFCADFSFSKIDIEDINILRSCKSLKTLQIKLPQQDNITKGYVTYLEQQFRRIKNFNIIF